MVADSALESCAELRFNGAEVRGETNLYLGQQLLCLVNLHAKASKMEAFAVNRELQ